METPNFTKLNFCLFSPFPFLGEVGGGRGVYGVGVVEKREGKLYDKSGGEGKRYGETGITEVCTGGG